MKMLLSSVIFTLSFIASSQTWCDNGANWKYSYMSFGVEGYTEFQYVGDTIISGQLSKQIDKTSHTYNFFNSQSQNAFFGSEYTYEDSGIVYIRYNNAWDTLHNFNASIGDSWKIAKRPLTTSCDTLNIQTVLDIGIMNINGLDLRYLIVEFNGFPNNTDTIVEKIGFIGGYFFLEDYCDIPPDSDESGPFRCYNDDNFPTYKPHYTGACDFVVGLDENNHELNFLLAPNPAITKIELIGIGDYKDVLIKDIQGKEWSYEKNGNIIYINELPSGIYVLSVRNDQGVNHQRFIKK